MNILVIDVGTTTMRAAIVDESLRIVDLEARSVPPSAPFPGLVEFETNFGNLTGGMSWVEEFLPLLGDEMIFVATRREYAPGERAPAAPDRGA